ncbi:flagellar protein FliO/FliZ [Clostridium punense]|uniref:Flagellar protein n=1 Tax=Clostridium punense TaxID=1054297 RepID=A0ABS4K1Z3_9CLOT|nr:MULTISPECIES: flagellar biosynthetic protein FliO [Clostridium]EQB87778.1 hypothetical protein M918_07390 [Clostridium sp. BL8]MBP2021794.1 flagellar protein FliO/FliZ [Clostridium punense]
MDGNIWTTLLKILVFFPFTIALILILGKVGSKFNLGTSGKFMKILERLPLSKENSLLIVKVGDKAYLISSSNGKIEILKEMEPEEIEKIREINALNMQQFNNGIEGIKMDSFKLSKLISKFNLKKSDDDQITKD